MTTVEIEVWSRRPLEWEYDAERYQQETGFALDAIDEITKDALSKGGSIIHSALAPECALRRGYESGSFGESAIQFNRNCILVDNNEEAIDVMKCRFVNSNVDYKNDD
jgi:hypothetical protein